MTTLLLVDDNELDIERVERGLRRLEVAMPIVTARDGLEALDKLRDPQGGLANSPVVVLLDINMPRMNGIEFLAELRSDETLQATPVVVFTTSTRPADLREAHRLSINGYVVKPSARDDFMHALSTILSFCQLCHFPARLDSAAR